MTARLFDMAVIKPDDIKTRRLTLDNAGLERPQDPQEDETCEPRDALPKAGQAQEEESVAHGATLVRPG